MKYFNEYKKSGFAALGFNSAVESPTPASQSRAFHLAALCAQKTKFTDLVESRIEGAKVCLPLLDLDHIMATLKPLLLISKSNALEQVSDSLKAADNAEQFSKEDIQTLGRIFTIDGGQRYLEI